MTYFNTLEGVASVTLKTARAICFLFAVVVVIPNASTQDCIQHVTWSSVAGPPRPNDLEYSTMSKSSFKINGQRVAIKNIATLGNAADINNSIKSDILGGETNSYVLSVEGNKSAKIDLTISFNPPSSHIGFDILDVDRDPSYFWQDSIEIRGFYGGSEVILNINNFDFRASQIAYKASNNSFVGLVHQSNDKSVEGNIGFSYLQFLDSIKINYFYTDRVEDAMVGQQLIGLSDIEYNSTISCTRPITINDHGCAQVGVPLTINILDNDQQPSPFDTASLKIVDYPNKGTVLVNFSKGNVEYSPIAAFYGQDSFTYAICDKIGNCDTAQVKVSRSPINSVFAKDDIITTCMNAPLTGNLLTNDKDIQGDAFELITSFIVQPVHGTVVMSKDGTFTYTPNDGYIGRDEFGV